MSVLNLQVSEGFDDANEWSDGSMEVIGGNIYMGSYASRRHAGFRFQSVSGLSGSTITDATVTFRANASDSGSFIGTMYAHDAVAPGLFTGTDYNITDTGQRPRTTASVASGSAELGNWSPGFDYTLAVQALIQELADSYDSSIIVLLFIYSSGTSERVVKSYESASATAVKLDITFEAVGGVAITPSALVYGWSIPTPTFSPQIATFTPDALAYGWAIPEPVIVAGVLVEPSALAYGWSIPTPTWSGITTYTPDALAYGWAIPTPSVVAGVSITPTVLAYGWAIPTPTFSPQVATFTPTAVAYGWVIPTPTVAVGLVSYPAEGRSLTTRFVDVSKYPDDALYYLEVVMVTSNALVPAYARLWNITDGVEVQDSEVSDDETDETAVEPVRSSALTLSGTKRYRAEFGGEPGSEIRPIAWDMVVVTS